MVLILLTLHNLMRWVIVMMGGLILVKAAIGLNNRQDWKKGIIKNLRFYTTCFNVQVLIGFLLGITYSPIMRTASVDFSAALRNPTMRFFSVTHVALIFIALMLVHTGHSRIKKALTAARKYKQTLIWIGLSFLLVILAIPWPFMPVARPFLRLFGISF
jgi:hypothetical protein